MITFDICARSISYPLCLMSEFGSVIKIKTLLALPFMYHITSIFSKEHVQFLGNSALWTSWNFRFCYPALWIELVHCRVTSDTKNILFLDFFPNLKPWNDLLLPHLCWTHLWFLSHPIKTILPVGEDWLFGLCRIMSSSNPAVMGKVVWACRLNIHLQCHSPKCAIFWISVLEGYWEYWLRVIIL